MCFLLETLASTFICWGSLTTGLKYPRIQGLSTPSTQTTGSKRFQQAQKGSNQEQKNINSWNCPCYIPSNMETHNLFEASFSSSSTSAAWSKDRYDSTLKTWRSRWEPVKVAMGHGWSSFQLFSCGFASFHLWISTSSYFSTYPRINEDICGNPVLLQSE